MTGQLSGREDETRSIEDFLDRASARPSMLVLSGDAGIGKTALWQAGLERARVRGVRVLSHRAVEAEAVLSFAGVTELLSGVADKVLPRLGALRHRALEAALLIDGSGGEGAVSKTSASGRSSQPGPGRVSSTADSPPARPTGSRSGRSAPRRCSRSSSGAWVSSSRARS
jgi:hypothetical protein